MTERNSRPVGGVATAIKLAERAAAERIDRALRPAGLTKSRFGVLQALQHLERASSAALARTVFISPQAMVGIVSWLERHGLITRTSSTTSARVIETEVTPAGLAAYAEAAAAMRAIDRAIEAEFDGDELRRFSEYLERIVRTLRNGDETIAADAEHQ